MALLAGLVARATELKEDASLAAFFLVSLAVGVTIVSLKGTNIDLLHFLFGTVLALDDRTLELIGINTTVTLFGLALIYRPLVIECVDPGYLALGQPGRGAVASGFPGARRDQSRLRLSCPWHLLAVGIMMIPAAIGRFWARDITLMIVIAVASGIVAGFAGLLLSFHTSVPAGPAIILVAGVIYVFSVLFGPVGGLVRQLFPGRHLEA